MPKKPALSDEELAKKAALEEKRRHEELNEDEQKELDLFFQKEHFDKKARAERAASKVEDRKKLKEAVVGRYIPSMQEGSMSKARHLAGLTAEGVAAELIIDLLIFAYEIVDNSPYKEALKKYDAAVEQEEAAFQQEVAALGARAKQKVHLVYREDKHGKYPKIYYADPATGELDYSRVVPHDKVTPFDIRANGLIPVPTREEGLMAAFDRHIERMNDSSWLRPDQKLRIHGVLDQAEQAMKGRDLAADRAAQLAAAQKFAKPGKP